MPLPYTLPFPLAEKTSVLQHNPNVQGDLRGRLLEQYKSKPRIDAVLQSFAQEIQALEDATWAVIVARNLALGNPTGDLLAKIGGIVGQASCGFPDDLYLLLIIARIRVNRSGGSREELLTIASLLSPGLAIGAEDYYPATFLVTPLGPLLLDPYLEAQSFLGPAVVAGVRLVLLYTPSPLGLAATWIGASVHCPGFDPGPAPTCPDVTAAQCPGSVHHASFTAGPPTAHDGGALGAGVVQVEGGSTA